MNVLWILCIYPWLYHYFCCFWSKLSTALHLAVDITVNPSFYAIRCYLSPLDFGGEVSMCSLLFLLIIMILKLKIDL